jgi:hypothetical protein
MPSSLTSDVPINAADAWRCAAVVSANAGRVANVNVVAVGGVAAQQHNRVESRQRPYSMACAVRPIIRHGLAASQSWP